MLTETERRQLLVEWNTTQRGGVNPPLQDLCIHQLFEHQVEQTPEMVAVVCDEEHFTYEYLNCKANQLAHYLQRHGLQASFMHAEMCVGLYFEKGPLALLALLAVLKAGGVSVFLDPTGPATRLASMIEDAHLQLVMTQEPQYGRIQGYDGPILSSEQFWSELQRETDANLAMPLAATRLAYIVSTSGSTGRPKGILSTHMGVVNYLRFLLQTYQ